MQQNEWIYDWNVATPPAIAPGTRVLLNDETLRDGLQNPSVFDPSVEEKIEILHLMEALGIDAVNIGLPGAGPRAVAHTEALAREIATAYDRRLILPSSSSDTARNLAGALAPLPIGASDRVTVTIEDEELCPRYAAAVADLTPGL